jgi:hypothetical protein
MQSHDTKLCLYVPISLLLINKCQVQKHGYTEVPLIPAIFLWFTSVNRKFSSSEGLQSPMHPQTYPIPFSLTSSQEQFIKCSVHTLTTLSHVHVTSYGGNSLLQGYSLSGIFLSHSTMDNDSPHIFGSLRPALSNCYFTADKLIKFCSFCNKVCHNKYT